MIGEWQMLPGAHLAFELGRGCEVEEATYKGFRAEPKESFQNQALKTPFWAISDVFVGHI